MDKEEHYIIIKRSILQEDVMILKAYVPKTRVSKYMEKKK